MGGQFDGPYVAVDGSTPIGINYAVGVILGNAGTQRLIVVCYSSAAIPGLRLSLSRARSSPLFKAVCFSLSVPLEIYSFNTDDGPLLNGGWGTGTECQQQCRGKDPVVYR